MEILESLWRIANVLAAVFCISTLAGFGLAIGVHLFMRFHGFSINYTRNEYSANNENPN